MPSKQGCVQKSQSAGKSCVRMCAADGGSRSASTSSMNLSGGNLCSELRLEERKAGGGRACIDSCLELFGGKVAGGRSSVISGESCFGRRLLRGMSAELRQPPS